MRHGLRSTVLALGACALLSGCFGSGSPTPAADHTPHKSRDATPSTDATSTPTTPPTSEPTSAPTTGTASGPALAFSPKSDGRHSHTCYTISGSAPVDFVYYPVLVKATSPLHLTSAAVTFADGVQVAGAWVAPSAATRGTGTVQGWPPSDLIGNPSVQWNQRVPAVGADLTPGTWYNVFLHLRVYPDALPLKTDGIDFEFTTGDGGHSVLWADHVAFQTTC
jgi:hypothetical protein